MLRQVAELSVDCPAGKGFCSIIFTQLILQKENNHFYPVWHLGATVSAPEWSQFAVVSSIAVELVSVKSAEGEMNNIFLILLEALRLEKPQ